MLLGASLSLMTTISGVEFIFSFHDEKQTHGIIAVKWTYNHLVGSSILTSIGHVLDSPA